MRVTCKKCQESLKVSSKPEKFEEKINTLTAHMADCGQPRECFPHLIKKKIKSKNKILPIDYEIEQIIKQTKSISINNNQNNIDNLTENMKTITI